MSGRDDYRRRSDLVKLGAGLVESVHQVAVAIATLGEGLALAVAAASDRPTPVVDELLVRHLGVEHMGRWVLIPGRPNRTVEQRDPAGLAIAGRLVGLEPGEYPQVTNASVSRTLILLQGGRGHEHLVPVDAVIRVGAREWS